MKTISLNEKHEIFLDQNGNIEFKKDEYALLQDLKTSLLFIKKENPFDLNMGIDWQGKILGSTTANINYILEQINTIILNNEQVINITEQTYNYTIEQGLTIETTIATIFGTIVL